MKTIVNLLLDETGSMYHLRDTVISAINEYVESFRNESEMYFKLSLFNSDHFTEKPLAKMRDFYTLTYADYIPSATTPLYDSVIKSIKSLERDIRDKKRNVLFVIYTDGEENSSVEYSQKDVFDQIQKKQKEGWTFVFMGANQDSWGAGVGIGIAGANTQNFTSSVKGVTISMKSLRQSTQTYVDTNGTSGTDFWNVDSDDND